GDGAARFAAEIGAERARLLTPSTRRMWVERLAKARETPESVRRRAKLAPVVAKTVGEERGTVNFIALDRAGDIAFAVSTSGWALKYPGRPGDSPILGAGNHCDTRHGRACSTGLGDHALRDRDVARSARFYRELIGVSVGDVETHGDDTEPHVHASWGEWTPREPSLLMLNIYPASGAITMSHIGFAVGDLAAAHARLVAANVA